MENKNIAKVEMIKKKADAGVLRERKTTKIFSN